MNADNVRRSAWAMPLTSPSYPRGPYRFVDREFLVISYRTDPQALAALVPEPLIPAGDVVRFEFIRMPDSTGFGDYSESGQVIAVTLKGRAGVYVHSMYLDDDAPIAGGREIWGFPKKLGSPKLRVDKDTLLGTLDYGRTRIAVGTMGYKHRAADRAGPAQLAAEDHARRGLQPAGVRAGRVPPRGSDVEGCVGRAGRVAALRARPRPGGRIACAPGSRRPAPHHRPDARARPGGARLPGALSVHFPRSKTC